MISEEIVSTFVPLDFPRSDGRTGHAQHSGAGALFARSECLGCHGLSTWPAIYADDLGITTAFYNFRDFYGFDPEGNALNNQITENQKQRRREIFELYGAVLGIDFIESADLGMTIVTGDMRALDPLVITGPGGVLGLAGGRLDRHGHHGRWRNRLDRSLWWQLVPDRHARDRPLAGLGAYG